LSAAGEVDTTAAWRVLIVSAETNRDLVKSAMTHWAMEPVCCSSLHEARGLLPDPTLSLIFCEDKLADGTYLDLLHTLGKPLKTPLVVISQTPDVNEKYNEAIEVGAFDVIASPCQASDVQWMLVRAIQEEARHVGRKSRA